MNYTRNRSQQLTAAALFCLTVLGLFCAAIEPYSGPYGRLLGIPDPGNPQDFMPLGMLAIWTSISGLALFILLTGYHRWRSICPLSWFSQLSVNWDRGRKPNLRKTWFEEHSYDLRLVTLAVSLGVARLLFINSDSHLLAGATILLFGTALITNTRFTGKTWCHYVCPMGPVEEVLSGVRSLFTRQVKPKDSKCVSCSACVSFCPDIDAEKARWKNILSPARRRFTYSYWGLILGFFGWSYLCHGTFDYYLSAGWTREGNVLGQLFAPGFFFWPSVPKLFAAPLTVVAFMVASYGLFSGVEKLYSWYLTRKKMVAPEVIRNRMFNFTNSLSVVTYLAFAVAPVLYLLPQWPGVSWAAVAAIAMVGACLVTLLRPTAR